MVDELKEPPVCVAATCVNAPIGRTKAGWCPFCSECLAEMLSAAVPVNHG